VKCEHPSPFGAHWRGMWIWHRRPAIRTRTATRPELADATDTVALFRRVVDVVTVPASAPARIWVDGRFILTVNGKEVARGPVRAEPRLSHYDVVDLAPHLVAGENVLAITARHFGEATSWWMPVPPSYSLGGGSLLFEALIGDDWVVSDRSWRCRAGEAWTAVAVPGDVACLPLESFDSRAHPFGWDAAHFDDADGWTKAIEITPVHTGAHGDRGASSAPFGMLRPPVRTGFPDGATHVARLVRTRRVVGGEQQPDPVRQVLHDEHTPEGGDVHLLDVDLERIAAGTLVLSVRDASPGTVIDIAAAEHIDAAGCLVTLGQHSGLRYVCRGEGVETFESFDVIGTRHLHVSVRPGGATQSAAPTIELAIHDRHRPRPHGASFACSDPLLEQIHAVGLRTVDLCALDAYVDCPTREQRAWTGDSVVHQMVDLVSNPDWAMAIRHPQMAASPRPDGMLPMAAASDFARDDSTIVPDWSLHWVRSVFNLYRYTGDRDVIAEMLPVAERTLRWFESYLADDGLLHDVDGWSLLDWSSVYANGTSSVMNALWARALEDVAEMAAWLGNHGTAVWATHRRNGVREGFEAFWDDGRGVYVDHIVDGEQRRAAAQHGGAAALAAGIVPDDRIARVVERLVDRSRLVRHSFVMDPVTVDGGSTGFVYLVTGYPEPVWDVEEEMVEAQPFFRYVLHDGLARAGRADLIADLCRDWVVFLDAGETSWPECWTGGTRCHGWSSTPTRDLIVHTLGITPGEPGYGAVRVVPALGDLEWARATVPTPHGPITVEAYADGRVIVNSPVPVVRD
jgi:alpha-L-rhamnosidase